MMTMTLGLLGAAEIDKPSASGKIRASPRVARLKWRQTFVMESFCIMLFSFFVLPSEMLFEEIKAFLKRSDVKYGGEVSSFFDQVKLGVYA